MEKIEDYKVLEKVALEMGFFEAKVIPADDVVVEDRVRLRCMIGCPHYGKGLRCPPHTPSIDEFRKMLSEYSFAMVVKLKVHETSKDLMAKYSLNVGEESVRLRDQYSDIDKMSSRLWSEFSGHYRDSLMNLLELERAAFNLGYAFATVFFAGRCLLCEKCDVETGICRNPMIARFSAEAMGINILKTAENAKIDLKFNSENGATPVAILLID